MWQSHLIQLQVQIRPYPVCYCNIQDCLFQHLLVHINNCRWLQQPMCCCDSYISSITSSSIKRCRYKRYSTVTIIVYVCIVLLMTSEKVSKPIGCCTVYTHTLVQHKVARYYIIEFQNQTITWLWACLWI